MSKSVKTTHHPVAQGHRHAGLIVVLDRPRVEAPQHLVIVANLLRVVVEMVCNLKLTPNPLINERLARNDDDDEGHSRKNLERRICRC